ncbi:D-alanyl-D-alanine carboxypeptidase family protein [Fuchsiella alkaliacetigena]|uniref:D-alanyl-D-alanine carboxypeptidase family protein n=1 Tax=Fuchsiella alkaliacetigena TaxID=957042 RepID=UPI00200A7F6F|nr:D-alanyl-D-alanine carboxypeptidase family protein [Fuchsiella alkaliacetigena]MCK8825162.1 D-alanyl-D-alanine carboxypeptidase [Fuchsiella alkaliacetigena]
MIKKLATAILVAVIVFSLALPTLAVDIPDPQFELEARSALLMEADSGRVIYQKNAEEQLAPASITKIMTLLLTMEAIEEGRASWDDVVTTSERAADMGGSQIWLEPGEEMTLEEMVKAIAIVSANDACVAVAEHLYGSEEAFVEVMNNRAEELGMENTHFVNTNGLPPGDADEQGNYSTAYDVALMSRELLKHGDVLEYTSTWIDYLRDGESFLRNTNDLVKSYRGADGLKTGYVEDAGFCVAATAEREGIRFISVIMKDVDSKLRFEEAAQLLSYGFNIYQPIEVAKKGEVLVEELEVYKGKDPQIKAIAKEDLNVAVIRGAEDKLKKQVLIDSDLTAPLAEGDRVGELRVLTEDKELDSVELVSDREVERGNIIQIVIQLLKRFLHNLVNIF